MTHNWDDATTETTPDHEEAQQPPAEAEAGHKCTEACVDMADWGTPGAHPDDDNWSQRAEKRLDEIGEGIDALQAENAAFKAEVERLKQGGFKLADEADAEIAALRATLATAEREREALTTKLRILHQEAVKELHGGKPQALLQACQSARTALEAQ